MESDEVIAVVVASIGILIVILIALFVMTRVGNDYHIAKGFCLDKDGMWDVSEYDAFKDIEEVNCSDKDHYGLPTEATS